MTNKLRLFIFLLIGITFLSSDITGQHIYKKPVVKKQTRRAIEKNKRTKKPVERPFVYRYV